MPLVTDVVGIGNAIVDVIAHADEAFLAAQGFAKGAMTLIDTERAETLYFCFFLQYDVMADDRSGGIEEVWVNPATRSIPRLASLLETMETRDDPALPEWSTLLPQAWELALANASRSIEFRLGGFLSSVERRRERDLQRMRDYYQTIDEEIRRKIARVASKGVGGPSDSPTKEAGVGSAKRDEQTAGVHPVGRTVGPTLNKEDARKSEIDRLAATARAYEARAAELQERYRVRVRIMGLAALVCAIPTYEIRVQLLRRSARTEASFSWNPFDRKIEPRCCDACRQSTEAAVLCDDRVHYLCLECLKYCPSCSKLFCRACHSRCPRTHR